MEKYESKQGQIFKSAAQIYPLISNFSLLTPAVADKVEEWQATEDTCSFKVKGFTVKLRMIDKVYGKHVKITGDDGGVPIDFAFWIQLHEYPNRYPYPYGSPLRTQYDDAYDGRQ